MGLGFWRLLGNLDAKIFKDLELLVDMGDIVEDIMVKRVYTCNPEMIVQDAAKLMKKKNISGLVIIKEGLPVGVVTERDIVFKAVAGNICKFDMKVGDIMSSEIRMVEPETKIYLASGIIEKNKIKRLPVVKGGKLVGILTQTDLIRYFTKVRNKLALDKFAKNIRSR